MLGEPAVGSPVDVLIHDGAANRLWDCTSCVQAGSVLMIALYPTMALFFTSKLNRLKLGLLIAVVGAPEGM